uniref:Uncharacterized protein n=1 Tax=Euplotes crassus TaxID=5936 RepID=A0A7S3KLA0_EUPCR
MAIGIRVNYKLHKGDENSKYWGEYYSGLKEETKSRMNTLIFLIVRILSVIIVLCLKSIWYKAKSSLYAVVHVIFSVFLLKVSPFEETKDNINEKILQINYFLACLPLIYLDHESRWSSTFEDIYSALLLSGPILCLLVSFYFLFKELYLKYHDCKSPKITQDPIMPLKANKNGIIAKTELSMRYVNYENKNVSVTSNDIVLQQNPEIMKKFRDVVMKRNQMGRLD